MAAPTVILEELGAGFDLTRSESLGEVFHPGRLLNGEQDQDGGYQDGRGCAD